MPGARENAASAGRGPLVGSAPQAHSVVASSVYVYHSKQGKPALSRGHVAVLCDNVHDRGVGSTS